VRRCLDAFEKGQQKVPGDFRPRIEHVQLVHPDDLPRFRRLGVIASMQPLHATSDMHMADRFWGDRSRRSYAWRSLRDAGAALAFGSDCPVEPLDPLSGLHAAVTRQRPDGSPRGGWTPEQRITLTEALLAYTYGSAFAAGQESDLGTLAPGKLADLVVLSHDIFAIPPEEILHTEVVMTMVGGRIVHQKES
jgi:predicted amidohydrolase YtcJ